MKCEIKKRPIETHLSFQNIGPNKRAEKSRLTLTSDFSIIPIIGGFSPKVLIFGAPKHRNFGGNPLEIGVNIIVFFCLTNLFQVVKSPLLQKGTVVPFTESLSN